MAPTTGSSSLLTPDEEAMALLQSGPLSPDVPPEDDDDCSSSASTESTGKLKSDDDDEPSSGSHRGPLRLRVKCSGSNLRPPPSSDASNAGTAAPGAEYPLTVRSPAATVADLKASVRQAVLGSDEPDEPDGGERYLRLIVRGRLLAPDAAPVSNFGLRDEDVVHAVVAAAGVRGGPQERLARGVDLSDIGSGSGRGGAISSSGRRRGRSARGVGIDAAGIIVNGGGTANNDDSDSSDSDEPGDGDDADDLEAGRRRRGFDRLRATGLSREEVAILRDAMVWAAPARGM